MDKKNQSQRSYPIREVESGTYHLSVGKAIGILVTAILTAFVSGAVAMVATFNADHFALLAISARVTALETNAISPAEIQAIRESLSIIQKNTEKTATEFQDFKDRFITIK